MILGVIASSSCIASRGALGTFNFVTGAYNWNGGALTAADVVDQIDWIGAAGLAVPGDAPAGAQVIHAPAASLIESCHFTAVLEVEILGDAERSLLLTTQNSGGAYYVQASYWDEWEGRCNDGVGAPFAIDDANGISNGVHKLAITRIDNKVALSVDGNAVVIDATACVLPVDGFPMVEAYLGGYSTGTLQAVNIRALAVYSPQPNSALPGLSAP
jgi:hypothetical protein